VVSALSSVHKLELHTVAVISPMLLVTVTPNVCMYMFVCVCYVLCIQVKNANICMP
jgi:hypothetical protein